MSHNLDAYDVSQLLNQLVRLSYLSGVEAGKNGWEPVDHQDPLDYILLDVPNKVHKGMAKLRVAFSEAKPEWLVRAQVEEELLQHFEGIGLSAHNAIVHGADEDVKSNLDILKASSLFGRLFAQQQFITNGPPENVESNSENTVNVNVSMSVD